MLTDLGSHILADYNAEGGAAAIAREEQPSGRQRPAGCGRREACAAGVSGHEATQLLHHACRLEMPTTSSFFLLFFVHISLSGFRVNEENMSPRWSMQQPKTNASCPARRPHPRHWMQQFQQQAARTAARLQRPPLRAAQQGPMSSAQAGRCQPCRRRRRQCRLLLSW